jgi:beta-mannosidase
MSLPGDIMSALLASGEIPDPYYGKNELGLQWIGREDWLIERDFLLDETIYRSKHLCFEAEVLDTVAEIRLNGRRLGESRSMFRRFRAEAKDFLVPGRNHVEIIIRSPEKAAQEAAAALPYPVPCSLYPVYSPHRNLIRKAQCMAGWDWGPCLMTGGVYDGIAILAHDGPRLDYLNAEPRRMEQGEWEVEVTARFLSMEAERVRIEAEFRGLSGPDGKAARAELVTELEAGSPVRKLRIRVKDPGLWWPAGYGEQTLHELILKVSPVDAPKPGACPLWEASKQIGFRELAVVAKEDEWGKSMKFAVNGREVFAKGANWIPADALPSRWNRKRLSSLLGSAVAANMNMLRVWGGGRYESEDFYALCDELGILIWQDCMFSCALYPASPDFLALVEAETAHQVLRMKDHPSLALWCGNNEALGAITWYEESKSSPARYIVDYDRLTEGTVGRVVRELDPGRQWWPSSPSAGPNDYSDNWHADGRGDMHYWSVWHEGKPFSAYLDVKPRFCSEFGFQSFPSERTVASFAPEGERNVTSPVMEDHQRHDRGNSLIVSTMLRYFRMPAGFRETLYLSQVQQALAIRTAVEYWRSTRPRCMGTLYWQLNDVWPVASWSSLEYDGGWKLLHYEAARFYEAIHLALFVKDGEIQAHAMNDTAVPLGGRLRLAFRRLDGSLVSESTLDAAVPADSSEKAWSLPLASLPAAPEEIFLEAAWDSGAGARRATLFLAEPKRLSLAEPRLSCKAEELPARAGSGPDAAPRLGLRIRAEAPAFWVSLELAPGAAERGIEGRFADSGFDLAAGEERLVPWLGTVPAGKASELEKVLVVMDLRSSYR